MDSRGSCGNNKINRVDVLEKKLEKKVCESFVIWTSILQKIFFGGTGFDSEWYNVMPPFFHL